MLIIEVALFTLIVTIIVFLAIVIPLTVSIGNSFEEPKPPKKCNELKK